MTTSFGGVAQRSRASCRISKCTLCRCSGAGQLATAAGAAQVVRIFDCFKNGISKVTGKQYKETRTALCAVDALSEEATSTREWESLFALEISL